MEYVNTLGAARFVPQSARRLPAPQAPVGTTLDALRRHPRPPLAWEIDQCARNFHLQRTPAMLAREAAAHEGRAGRPAGWIARGL